MSNLKERLEKNKEAINLLIRDAAFVLRWAGKIPPIFWVTVNPPEFEILDKWQAAGWWDHTTSQRAGWVTKSGFKALEEMTK